MDLNGFTYIPDFISVKEENQILLQLINLPWQEVKMYGVVAKRKVIHFGLNYIYHSRSVMPTIAPPSFIISLIERSAVILKIPPEEIVETLVTFYPVGAGIGWHKDANIFGNNVFGISLKSQCMMKFRKYINNKYEVIKKNVEPRSAYILSNEARWEWQHSISPVTESRYSITFRMKNEN